MADEQGKPYRKGPGGDSRGQRSGRRDFKPGSKGGQKAGLRSDGRDPKRDFKPGDRNGKPGDRSCGPRDGFKPNDRDRGPRRDFGSDSRGPRREYKPNDRGPKKDFNSDARTSGSENRRPKSAGKSAAKSGVGKAVVSRSDAAVAGLDRKPYGHDLRGTVKSGRPGCGRDDDRFGRGASARPAKPKAPSIKLPEADKTIMVTDVDTGMEVAVAVRDAGSDQFAARLKRVAKERRKWARKEDISCYRVYDADLPDFAVAIDRYDGVWKSEGESYLCIAEYEAPGMIDPVKVASRFADVAAIAPVVLGIPADHVFTKTRRREKGGGQYTDQQKGNFVAYTQEAGNVLQIDLGGYLDTGIFLDHRVTRGMVGEMAEGKSFLNLFSYTGTCTVHAAVGGARSTTTVDLSQTYLNWARRNMELNGCTGPEHSYVRADVLQWIAAECETDNRYDLIFVDPPTFSNSKAMGKDTWSVQRDHVKLLSHVVRLLTPGGQAVFSCNLRGFKPDVEELAKAGVALRDITEQTIPHDFERNPKIHKCYIATRLD